MSSTTNVSSVPTRFWDPRAKRCQLRSSGWLALALTFAVTLSPSHSTACLNGVELRVNPKVAAVQAAEASLRVGELSRAGRLVSEHFPQLRKVVSPTNPLDQRALRVLSIVILRTDGTWHEKATTTTAHDRSKNVAFALRQLRLRAIAKPNDAMRVTDLGEALERTGALDEAKHVLETLASSTSITSAEGWAALARLRAHVGDETGRRHAETMCRTMTRKEAICRTASEV